METCWEIDMVYLAVEGFEVLTENASPSAES